MPNTMASNSSSNRDVSKDGSNLAKQQSTITAILDKLDAADNSKFRNRRQAIRATYRPIDIPIRIFHPGGSVAFKAVAMRNLSATGAGFLYTGFLHIGTRIELTLPRRAGGEDVITGKVIFCAHVTGSFHQIGVRFEQKIVPASYVDRESMEKIEGAGLPPLTIGGSVLHIDDSEVDRKLMAHYLKSTKVLLTSVAGLEAAVEAVKATKFGLVLCELNFKTTTGEVIIAKLREAGYDGRFIVVTSETSAERFRAIRGAGAIGMLSKPYDLAKLKKLISPFLSRVAADDVVASTLAAEPSMQSLIERYVTSVRQLALEIETAAKENQLDRIRQICNSLKGSGSSYGFAILSESAKEAMRSLDATMSLQESNDQIRKLLDLCKRVIVR